MSNVLRPRISSSAAAELALSAALSILFVPAPASAEQDEGSVTQQGLTASPGEEAQSDVDQSEAAELDALYRSGSSLRTAGMVLTILGLGLAATGVGLIAAAASIHSDEGEGTLDMAGTGFFVLSPGILTLIIGIPLWVAGAARRNRARSMGYEATRIAAPRLASSWPP